MHGQRGLDEALDRRLLEREQPPVFAEAKRLLARNKIACDRVVHVDIDAVLYVVDERPMTAWLTTKPVGGTTVQLEDGFAAVRGFAEDA